MTRFDFHATVNTKLHNLFAVEFLNYEDAEKHVARTHEITTVLTEVVVDGVKQLGTMLMWWDDEDLRYPIHTGYEEDLWWMRK